VTWIDGIGYVVSPFDGVNGDRRKLNQPADAASQLWRGTRFFLRFIALAAPKRKRWRVAEREGLCAN
jgi:hypothetical protein